MSFSVKRNENGTAVVSLRNVNNYHVNGLGTASGDMDFVLGSTNDGSNGTVLQISQNDADSKLKFTMAATADGFQFNGSHIAAKANQSLSTAYNVEWNANNSSFDSTSANASVLFQATEQSYNNLIAVGDCSTVDDDHFDNFIVDSGHGNTYLALDTSSNLFETTAASSGVIIQTGKGDNTFKIGGHDGIYSGGSGNDTFITDAETSFGNVLFGNDGEDVLNDYATGTLFFGGAGADTANMYGAFGIANLGFNEDGNTAYFGNGSYQNAVFTAEEMQAADGTYSFTDIMKMRGWDLANYLENADAVNNPYFNELMAKLIQESLV